MNLQTMPILSANFLDGLTGGDKSQVLVLLGAFVALVIVTGIVHWSRVRRAEIETEFKRELLDRGMSIDEIDRLLRAGGRSSLDKR
jgi:hypothetical protein